MQKTKNGFGVVVLLVTVAILAVLGGTWYFTQRSGEEKMMEEDAMMRQDDGVMTEKEGQVLAGSSSLLLEFNQADYETALASDKLVVLYFYANWCPICRAEFPKMQASFNEFPKDTVIGFRVNYQDSDTDEQEVALARQFGIAYQHTKVFIKNGQQALKSLETWEKERYLAEMTRLSQ